MVFIGYSVMFFFFQAEDGIRDAQESRGLGDVYKRQYLYCISALSLYCTVAAYVIVARGISTSTSSSFKACLLYTSDAADDLLCVDLGGRRIITKKKRVQISYLMTLNTKQKHQ